MKGYMRIKTQQREREREGMISHLLHGEPDTRLTELHCVGVDNIENSHGDSLIEIDLWFLSSYDVWQTD